MYVHTYIYTHIPHQLEFVTPDSVSLASLASKLEMCSVSTNGGRASPDQQQGSQLFLLTTLVVKHAINHICTFKNPDPAADLQQVYDKYLYFNLHSFFMTIAFISHVSKLEMCSEHKWRAS